VQFFSFFFFFISWVVVGSDAVVVVSYDRHDLRRRYQRLPCFLFVTKILFGPNHFFSCISTFFHWGFPTQPFFLKLSHTESFPRIPSLEDSVLASIFPKPLSGILKHHQLGTPLAVIRFLRMAFLMSHSLYLY